jgi:GTPase-associated protein 1, N-terminal domain type 2/GTPase-associated protein 1, middle domain
MTAEVFDRLLYTDCLPGAGRGAGGGFQVQAQSSGVDSGQSKLAVGSLLYEVQVPWLNQRLPVGEFPLGFAHVCGDGYGTAQSRYLGKTAAGGRDGNHLADCLLTRDADRYGAIRPAQLWRSPLWRDEPWPDKECPQFDASGLEAGPLTADAVAEWARAQPERGPVLSRLLTLLEDPGGRRVVIVSDGPDEAMAWIAAATLLLPARQALEVSFKVFSSIPLRTEQRIAAAPAALFPQIAPGRAGAGFVLDARTGAADEGEVSERAEFLTRKFTGEGDPYDVIDAVELADALGDRGQHLGGRDAMLTAWALTRPDETVPEPPALFRWLASARPALLAEHGPAVTGLILGAAPTPDALRWIDAAVADKRLTADPAAVRVQLLAAELAQIRDGAGTVPVQEDLPAVPLDVSAHRDAESELSSAILLGSGKQADLLLCLARRHGIAPDLAAPLQERLRDFVSGWMDHPSGYHPDRWALGPEVLRCAYGVLRERAIANGVRSVEEVIRRLNRYFGEHADLSDPLDCSIQASLIAAEDRTARVRRLRQLLANIRDLTASPALAPVAPAAATGLQRALIDWRAVDGEVAVAVLTELPDSLDIDEVISSRAAQELDHMSEKPTRELLELLTRLDQRGKAPTSGRLARVLAADTEVRTFIRRAHDRRARTDAGYAQDTVKVLCEADQAVVQARLDEVLSACLEAAHPQLGAVVLTSLKSPLPRLLAERWGRTLGARDPVADGAWCVHCLDYEYLPDKRKYQLTDALRDYAGTISQEEFDAWYDEVARRVGPHKLALWGWVFPRDAPPAQDAPRAQETPRSRMSLWRNRDGRP